LANTRPRKFFGVVEGAATSSCRECIKAPVEIAAQMPFKNTFFNQFFPNLFHLPCFTGQISFSSYFNETCGT